MPRITRAQIDAKAADYETAESRFRAECKIDQDYLHATDEWRNKLLAAYIKGFPKGFVVKVLPLARMAVETFKNTIVAGEVPEVKDTLDLEEGEVASDAQEAKRKETERFHKAFLWEVAYRTSNNPFTELVRKQAALGPGILSFAWDETLWPKEPSTADGDALSEYEEAKREAWPWLVQVEHPLGIWPDPYSNPPKDYVIKDKLPLALASERYPQLNLESTTGDVERLIYCSETDYAVYINNLPLYGGDGVVDNPMGVLWYELALSGLGENAEDNNVVHLWQGVLRQLRDIIAMIITNYNIVEAVKWQEGFGPQHLSAASEAEAENVASKVVIGPLEILATGPNVTMEPLIKRTDKQSAIWEQDELTRWLEIMIGPLSGNFQKQESTASGLAQRVSMQELPYQAAKVSAEQAIANMLRKVTRFYKEHIGKTKISLRYGGKLQRFNPDDFLTDLRIEVNLKPVTAADRAMTVDKDLKELGNKVISLAEYRRRQAIENGVQLDEELGRESLRFHPAVVDVAAKIIAQQLMPAPAVQAEQAPEPAESPATESFTPNPTQNGQGDMMGAFANLPIPAGPGV